MKKIFTLFAALVFLTMLPALQGAQSEAEGTEGDCHVASLLAMTSGDQHAMTEDDNQDATTRSEADRHSERSEESVKETTTRSEADRHSERSEESQIQLCPPKTYMFAQKDGQDLCLDVYKSAEGADTLFYGKRKPTILFVFGGGFVGGHRDGKAYLPWFKKLTDNGYNVVSIDYRLGLKGVEMSFAPWKILGTARATRKAVVMAVEDLFSATKFIIDNAETLGIDPENIVISGSSAGAMTCLAAENEIACATELTKALPEGYNYRGVMSFAGAIVSDTGRPTYLNEPCTQLLFHGDEDKTVNYNKIHVFNFGIFGTNALAKIFKKEGCVYNIYRYHAHAHDMAENFLPTWPEQKRFLEENVIMGRGRLIDAYVDDPAVPAWEAATLDSLY